MTGPAPLQKSVKIITMHECNFILTDKKHENHASWYTLHTKVANGASLR
jgi:hypothetical protein